MPPILTHFNFAAASQPLFLILGLFMAAFLFWRAGRHELVDSDFLFNITIICLAGAALGGRIIDFLERSDFYQWRADRLIFANVYQGFDFWGAILGATLAARPFLPVKKDQFWFLADLAASPLVLAAAIIALGRFLANHPLSLYFAVGYFALFIIIKRLEKKKRHIGFFACLALTTSSAYTLIITYLAKHTFSLALILPCAVLVFASLSWYLLARRNLKSDLKTISASLLLIIFKIKRSLTNIAEADSLSKTIILLPFHSIRLVFNFVRIIVTEFTRATWDFIHVLGIKK